MLYSVLVSAAAGGWMVESDVLEGALMFRSGGRAEDSAWRIARALADNGAWVRSG